MTRMVVVTYEVQDEGTPKHGMRFMVAWTEDEKEPKAFLTCTGPDGAVHFKDRPMSVVEFNSVIHMFSRMRWPQISSETVEV